MAERTFEEGVAGLERGSGGPPLDDGAPRGEAADAASHPSVAAMRERFGAGILHHAVMAGDEHVVYVGPAVVVEVLAWLKDDAAQRYDFLADLTAVDYGGGRPLEVVYQLWSIEHKRALRLKVPLPLDALVIDSVTSLWHAADWLEREVFDLFGIHFRGHPDLRRILMPENYAEGHPLRKDFPLRGRFSRAEQTRRALATPAEEFYTPEELRIGDDETVRPPSPVVIEHAAPPNRVDAPTTRVPGGPTQTEDWSLGTEGSAAGGAPGPSGVKE
jgi:NADH-quinone oxidoreductase subunit C